MEQLVATRRGLDLCTETFGAGNERSIVLVAGGTSQGIVWPDRLCRALAESGYRVVRYDHRDTGKSSASDEPYGIADLAVDTADVIRGLDLGASHVVGVSVGGMVAQHLALDAPALVRSLVLLSSSPDANGDVDRAPETGLPAPHQVMLDHVASLRRDPPATPEATIDAAVRGWRVLVGPTAPFDEGYWRDLVIRTMNRARDPRTAGRHLEALDRTPANVDRLDAIVAPTLVVHGDQDYVLPAEHGRALARGIPGARLIEVEGLGHTFPPEWADRLHALIIEHLQAVDL